MIFGFCLIYRKGCDVENGVVDVLPGLKVFV